MPVQYASGRAGALARPGVAPYRPAGQGPLHDADVRPDWLPKVPALQLAQAGQAASLYRPGGHSAGTEAPPGHALPAGHSVQALAPAPEYVPAPQGAGTANVRPIRMASRPAGLCAIG